MPQAALLPQRGLRGSSNRWRGLKCTGSGGADRQDKNGAPPEAPPKDAEDREKSPTQRAGCSAVGAPSFMGTYSSRRQATTATTAQSRATTAIFLEFTGKPPFQNTDVQMLRTLCRRIQALAASWGAQFGASDVGMPHSPVPGCPGRQRLFCNIPAPVIPLRVLAAQKSAQCRAKIRLACLRSPPLVGVSAQTSL